MKRKTNVLRQISAAALIFGFASVAITGCEFFEKEKEGSTPSKKGNFNYTIIWPDTVTAEITLQRLPELTEIPLASVSTAKVNGKNRTLSQTLELDEGSYFFRALISNDNMYDGINEQILVSAGKVTIYTKTFTSDELVPTNPTSSLPITSADIVVIAPVKDAVPNMTASGAGDFSIGTVSWSPSHEKFLGGTVYTVRILLAANDGYTFTSLVSAKINGNDANVEYSNGSAALISYDFRTTEPVEYIANSYKAIPSDENIIYSYAYEGLYFHYIYLGQMENIPLYTFDYKIHDGIETDYTITVTDEIKDKIEDSISTSVQETQEIITTDSVRNQSGGKIGAEIKVTYGAIFWGGEAKIKGEFSWENEVASSKSKSDEISKSFSDTKTHATEHAKTTIDSVTYHLTRENPVGRYRYTMFGVSDVYLYVIRDPKTGEKYCEFKEFIIEDRKDAYGWGLEYTPRDESFGKKDTSSFILDPKILDNLPEPDKDLSPAGPLQPVYSSVTVSPSGASVEKGKTRQFSAVVNGLNDPVQAVTWRVTGGGSGTSISTSGLLTIATGETASILTVRATSVATTLLSGTASVILTPAIPTFTSVSALGSWLSIQRENTVGTAYNVRLNTSSIANIQSTLRNNNPKKYINLDFSGSTINEIPVDAFRDCFSLVRVTIPNTVKTIGKTAFCNCNNLASVNIGTGVIVIGYDAFSTCNFTSVTIPDNVAGLDQGAFYKNYNLESVIIGKGVKGIENYVFEYCNKLTSVTFGGKISPDGFKGDAFRSLGDIRAKFYMSKKDEGTPGTYRRTGNDGSNSKWYMENMENME